ncbi:MAG: hypothetical protein U1E86_03355 [Burkholderiaceae bacterium]
MNARTHAPNDTIGTAPYTVAGLSFIPLLGVVFGLVAIGWGIAARRDGGGRVAVLGALGIAFTALLYGGLFYLGVVQRGGLYDDARIESAQSSLDGLVPAIERFRGARGRYPDSLAELQPTLGPENESAIYDPSDVTLRQAPREFFYAREGRDAYYLRGIGLDGVPFTPDDLLPRMPSGQFPAAGLLLQRVASR